MSPFLIITLDGGAASGKSSTCRALAERFHFMHVDTGSYYRTLTWALLKAKIKPEESKELTHFLAQIVFTTKVVNSRSLLCINGVTPKEEELRTLAINEMVSPFSALPSLRAALLEYQRSQVQIAKKNGFNGLIAEGRDTGSVIFPQANFRFFLYADVATRIRRRQKEKQVDLLQERDKLDSQRQNAPLARPPGSLFVDTSSLTLEEVTQQIASVIQRT